MKDTLRRFGRRPTLLGGIVAVLVLGIALLPAAWRLIDRAAPTAPPVFPQTVAPYSWWTAHLSPGDLDAAIMLYQNGYAVEFLDLPQAVVVGTDGTTYRRLGAAESRTVPADQGDPAPSALAADGSFAVISGGATTGEVELVTLRDLTRRVVPVGSGRSAIPVSIDAEGRKVLLLTGDAPMSRYQDQWFRLHARVALLDLVTGEVRDYPGLDDVSTAALSPDGSRIAAETTSGLRLADAVTGEIGPVIAAPGWRVGDDAWSPAGDRLATSYDGRTVVLDVTGPEVVRHEISVGTVEWGDPVGWRDNDTLLVHGTLDPATNTSGFVWVNLNSGAEELFASYYSNFTAAALATPDVARSLVPTWEVLPTGIDRGGPGLVPAVVLALVAGLLARGIARRLTGQRVPSQANPESATVAAGR